MFEEEFEGPKIVIEYDGIRAKVSLQRKGRENRCSGIHSSFHFKFCGPMVKALVYETGFDPHCQNF